METDVLADDLRTPEVGSAINLVGQNLLVDWIRAEIQLADPNIQKYRDEYRKCRRFFDGKQLTKEDKELLAKDGRPDNAFNSAQKFVRFVTGVERVAPEALLFNPIDENDQRQQAFGEFVSRAYDWAIDKGKGNFERSTAFEDLIIGGMGWEDYSISYGLDPRGLPQMVRFSPLEALFPKTDRQNLEGARWRGRETWIDKDEARSRWPEDKFLIDMALRTAPSHQRPEATGPVIYEIPYLTTKPISDNDMSNPQRNKVNVLQFEWFDDEPGYYFFDPLDQDDTWLNKSDFFTYRRKLQKFMAMDVEDWVERPGRSYKRIFLLNRMHQLGDVIKLKRFHLNCMTGSFDDEDGIWYGFFRVLVDPQRFGNKLFNQLLEIMGRTAKGGGFLYEKGALLTNQVNDFKENYAKPGTSQEVATGALTQKKFLPKPQGEIPAATMSLLQYVTEMMDNVTGISPDQFNATGANVPGVTLRQKGKSALLLLSKEFDALSRYRVDEGLIVFDLLGSLADDRLIRIGGHADGAVVRLMHEPFATEYELSLDDTERDPNLRKMYEEAVMGIAPTLIRMNMFLPELLDYMRLPFRFKQSLKQAIAREFQQRQEAAKAGVPQGGRSSPVTPQERQAKIVKTQAETQVQLARAERLKTQSKRDEMRTLMEALVKASQLILDREKMGTEKASVAVDMFKAVADAAKPEPARKSQ